MARSAAIFDLDAARSALEGLREKAAAPDFWSRQNEAQEILRQTRGLERKVQTAARLDELREEYRTLHSDALDLVRAHTQRERTAAVREVRRKARDSARQRAAASGEQGAQPSRRPAGRTPEQLRARVKELESSWIPGAVRGRLSSLRRRSRS